MTLVFFIIVAPFHELNGSLSDNCGARDGRTGPFSADKTRSSQFWTRRQTHNLRTITNSFSTTNPTMSNNSRSNNDPSSKAVPSNTTTQGSHPLPKFDFCSPNTSSDPTQSVLDLLTEVEDMVTGTTRSEFSYEGDNEGYVDECILINSIFVDING